MAIVIIDENKFENVKIAVTEKEQQIGLMNVPWPPPLLLFPYKQANIKKFWMKNVESPLDIIFCKANEVIYIGVGEPFNEESIGPNESCNLVLEAPYGFVDYNNISVGSKIRIKYNKEELQYILKNGSPKLEINDKNNKDQKW